MNRRPVSPCSVISPPRSTPDHPSSPPGPSTRTEGPRWLGWPWLGGCLVAVLFCSFPTIQAANAQAPPSTHEIGRWIEALDRQGRTVESLETTDLEVLDQGIQVSVVSLSDPGTITTASLPPRLTLVFDRRLGSSRVLREAAQSFAGLARRLTELGVVEVLSAGEEIERTLESRDPLVLAERLSRAALTERGEHEILEIRRRTLTQLRSAPGGPELRPEEMAEVVAAGIREELELVRQRLRDLLVALNEKDGAEAPRARVLFWIVDGWDLDPVSFFTQHLDERALRELLREASNLPTLAQPTAELAQALAIDGWTVIPVRFEPPEGTSGAGYDSLETEGPEGSVTSAPGVTLRPGDLFRRRRDAEAPLPEPTLVQGRAPLERLAEASGGEVVVSESGLRDAVERLSQRQWLTFRAQASLDAGARTLEIRSLGGGLEIRAPRWWSPVPSEARAKARLERLLAGFDGAGELDVAAVLQVTTGATEGTLEARLSLRDLEASAPEEEWLERSAADLRVTVAVANEQGATTFTHRLYPNQDLRNEREWHFRTQLPLTAEATEVAVLVEEIGGGAWGGRRATVIEAGSDDLADVLPTPTVIEIRRPEDDLLRGRVKFETQVFDPRVTTVEFLLDDRSVARRERPPFAARIDLGRTPRRQQLTVVASDAAGNELGRDAAVLNGGAGGLAVKIVRPTSPFGVGAVEVEAEIEIPLERRLDRVLFFWNNEPVATLFGPPYRQRVVVPEDKPIGYVRVVAMLDDASMSEDVLFLNAPAVASERLEVQLVELYVVVTDDDGRPVRGLTQDDFRIREEGANQEISTFSDASDLPLTLGLALDSSASMFVKLPRIQSAAIDFLRSAFGEQDRAFVVDFDSEPRLARSTTGDLERLEQSILNLEANGRTAMWESVVFSLVQLQGVRGRKALIVFSDGADEDDDFPFRTTLDIARRMGVPIYLILMKKEPKESSGLSLFARSFGSRVDRLVDATGGRVFYAKEYASLDAVYDDIEYELRSQYLLGYYPKQPGRSSTWRDVDVEVLTKGLEPRTLSGYWQ